MSSDGMSKFIKALTAAGELKIVDAAVSSKLEITEITDRISKLDHGGPALLFSNTGTDFPVLINALGSEKRIKIAFSNQSPIDISKEVLSLFQQLTSSSDDLLSKLKKIPELRKVARMMPKKKKGKGRCQEVIMSEVSLDKLPILTCWPADGGPFITFPLVHTLDPTTGSRNVGMYRMQVLSKKETGMHWHMHKTGARHFREYKKAGKRMPVAVALGGDPVYTYCATAPLPDGIDEYLLAGFIRKKPVRLVKCLTQEMWVPEDADFIIEGYVDPLENLVLEGPFGDHTGFYSLADYYPSFHVTAITHKKNAVYPATIVGIPPQEDAWIAQATEELFMDPLKLSMIPELTDFHLPVPGVAHNIGLFSIQPDYPGMGKKILNSVWGAGQMMFTKFGVVFDQTQDLRSYSDLAREFTKRVNPLKDILITNGPLDILDHSSDVLGIGGKMGVDASGQPEITEFPDSEALGTAIHKFRSYNPEVIHVSTELVDSGISFGLIICRKNEKLLAKRIFNEIVLDPSFGKIKFWVLTDINLQDMSWFDVTWIVGSNVDPSRDVFIKEMPGKPGAGILMIDATRKSKEYDQFLRDWPNPVVMNKETISLVNKKWPGYQLGPLLISPSERFAPLMRGDEAVAQN